MLAFLQRFRLILFATMIFGAFANFALNEWGNTLVVLCQFMLALSFMWQFIGLLLQRIKSRSLRQFNIFQLALLILLWVIFPFIAILFQPEGEAFVIIYFALFVLMTLVLFADALISRKMAVKGLPYAQGGLENYTLFLCLAAFLFTNMHWPGAALLNVFSILFMAFPLYLFQTISFFRQNYNNGRSLVLTLTAGSVATILYGLSILFQQMHYPGALFIFYLAVLFSLLFLPGLLKGKHIYNNESLSVLGGLKLYKTHMVLVAIVVFLFSWYGFLRMNGVAPSFYESNWPASVNELSSSGKPGDLEKSKETRESYLQFIENCRKNGILK